MDNKKLTKEEIMWRSLHCLYIEVPRSVADDVKQKVTDAFNELKESINN